MGNFKITVPEGLGELEAPQNLICTCSKLRFVLLAAPLFLYPAIKIQKLRYTTTKLTPGIRLPIQQHVKMISTTTNNRYD